MTNGTRRECGVSVTPRPLFTPRKDPVPIVQEAGWAPGPVRTGAENLAPLGFDPRTVQHVASRYTFRTLGRMAHPVRIVATFDRRTAKLFDFQQDKNQVARTTFTNFRLSANMSDHAVTNIKFYLIRMTCP
jgi:hypothetical protein